MKVKIGKFPTRLMCNIHSNFMNKKYEYNWPDEMLWDHEDFVIQAINDGIQNVYDMFNWIWFDRRKQKVSIRIDKHDTWSMDHTLAPIILPMLKQLKETNHGYPALLGEKEWDDIMDEMIWAFEQKCRDDWEGDYYEYREMGPEESKDPDSLFGLKLVWEDREGQAAHQERMTNGFKLFGEYYENLWD
jgi:hypothetical protein